MSTFLEKEEFSNLLSNKLAKKLLESNVRIFILLEILIIMEMSNFVIYIYVIKLIMRFVFSIFKKFKMYYYIEYSLYMYFLGLIKIFW